MEAREVTSRYIMVLISVATCFLKVKVESIVSDETYEAIIDQVIDQINTGEYGDGKIFVYDVYDAIRIRTGERGTDAL